MFGGRRPLPTALPHYTFLHTTKNKVLVEATPDKFWASGLHPRDTMTYTTWPGLNHLGKLLMALRSNPPTISGPNEVADPEAASYPSASMTPAQLTLPPPLAPTHTSASPPPPHTTASTWNDNTLTCHTDSYAVVAGTTTTPAAAKPATPQPPKRKRNSPVDKSIHPLIKRVIQGKGDDDSINKITSYLRNSPAPSAVKK